MVKVLSQDEIDSLISSAAGEESTDNLLEEREVQERNVISYDFKHPNRVNKDQLRGLESLHDNFSNQLGSAISAYTRSMVDVNLVAVDQITYSEYILSLSAPSSSYIFNMEPLGGAGIINFSSQVAFFIIDRIFGGRGEPIQTERELTGIERSIMNKIINKTLAALEKAWEQITPVDLSISAYETNPQFIQIVPPGETVITVSLQVKLHNSNGVMTVCYPYISLEEIIQKLSTQNWIDSSKMQGKIDKKGNFNRLRPVGIDLVVRLTGTTITMRDILKVKIGDVICLDNSVNDDFTVLIHKKPKFLAKLGNIGNKRAVRLKRIISPKPIDIDELKDEE